MASQKENVRTTTPKNINENNDDEGSNTINALRREIDELKRKLLDKEENIDDLVRERDEGGDEIYDLKLKLANAWNVLRNARDNGDRVIEVGRIIRTGETKSYCPAAKQETATNALRKEIEKLKDNLSDKENTIDDLVQERDEAQDEVYELKLKLADAWKITKFTDNGERVREVARLIKINRGDKSYESYCAAAKGTDMNVKSDNASSKLSKSLIRTVSRNTKLEKEQEKSIDGKDLEKLADTRKHDKTDATKPRAPVTSIDSGIGIDVDTLKDHLERKIDSLIEIKLNERLPSLAKSETVEGEMGSTDAPTNDMNTNDDTSRKSEARERENNLIIHGLEETECNNIDQNKVIHLFNAVGVKFKPQVTYRLGKKEEGKRRPLMVCLQSKMESNSVMSNMWRLGNLRNMNERVSVTYDYTLEERRLIKEFVEEAKRRNMNAGNDNDRNEGYAWRVRGTPKTKLRIVKIRQQTEE